MQSRCPPDGVKNHENYFDILYPEAVNIDQDVNPILLHKAINIFIQGEMTQRYF